MWRRPVLEINKVGGGNILPSLRGLWESVSTSESAGQKSDTAEIVCVGPPSFLSLPKRGDEYEIVMGWKDEGGILQGRYKVQKVRLSGDAEGGDLITIGLRAADFVDKLKAGGREHYDAETLGERMKKIGKAAELDVSIDESLKGLKVPYGLRWDQSLIDFANEQARPVGAIVKPSAGKLLVLKRGSGKSAGGQPLEPIFLDRRMGYAYDIETDARPEHGEIAATYHDPKSGKRKTTKHKDNREGPARTIPHPFRSEEEAKRAAEADAYEADHRSGSGTFEGPGLPRARAEADAIVTGYGFPIDGKWKAENLRKVITKRGAFLTTVTVGAGNEKKGAKST